MGIDINLEGASHEDHRQIEFEVLQILQFRLACDKNPADYLKKTLNRLRLLRIDQHQKSRILDISTVFTVLVLLNWPVLSSLFTIEETTAAAIYMGVKYYEKTELMGASLINRVTFNVIL